MGELFAMKTPSEKLDLDTVEYPIAIQPKLDGIRGIWDGKEFLSFGGNPIGRNIPDLSWHAQKLGGCVLDGEMWAPGKTMAEINGILKAGPKKGYAQTFGKMIRFRVFDMLTADEWATKTCTRPWVERDQYMWDILPKEGPLQPLQHFVARDRHHLEALHESFLNQGWEGSMLKKLDGLYHWTRHPDWLRYKPVHTEDFKIVDAIEGGGKWNGALGAFIIDVGKGRRSKAGGGRITLEERREWLRKWETGEIGPGTWVEVEFKCRTDDGKPREPQLIRLREDKE